MKLNINGNPPRYSPSHRVLYWSIVAKHIPSQTGPQPIEASPMLQTMIPDFLFIFLYRAAPTEISPEPPTIALLGYIPNGVKKACIDPPRPLLKPFSRANISASAPYSKKLIARSFIFPWNPFSTTLKADPPK